MRLSEYLHVNHVHPEDFAKKLGVSRQTVFLWMSGTVPRCSCKRKPSALIKCHIHRIEKITRGDVMPADFYRGDD